MCSVGPYLNVFILKRGQLKYESCETIKESGIPVPILRNYTEVTNQGHQSRGELEGNLINEVKDWIIKIKELIRYEKERCSGNVGDGSKKNLLRSF